LASGTFQSFNQKVLVPKWFRVAAGLPTIMELTCLCASCAVIGGRITAYLGGTMLGALLENFELFRKTVVEIFPAGSDRRSSIDGMTLMSVAMAGQVAVSDLRISVIR
jgi:NCS2 family nucleobase:cation symporter-2